MVHIPRDIWLCIADFLPDSVLYDLFALNSTLFHLAIDVRYKEVTIKDLGDKNTTRKILRLRDPFVALRVRRLNMFLESNYDFFRNWKSRRRRSRWGRLVDKLAGKPSRPRSALDEVVQELTSLVTCLPNVTALHVSAREGRLHEHSGPVFDAAWKTFGHNLRTLSLQGSVEYFQNPLSLTDFSSLREIRMEFTDVSCVHSAPLVNAVLCQTIVPALNRVSPAIENFSVSFGLYTWGHLDLSDFLRHLEPMPRLNRLTINVPPHKLGDPSGLLRILREHASSLRHIKLRLDCYNWTREPGSEERLRSLMEDFAVDRAVFQGLESFEFSPTIHTRFDMVTGYLMRSADTLTSLTITDRFLNYEDVAVLGSIFIHRPADSGLRSLVLNIQFFGPRLLTLLATMFPTLKWLSLCAFNWGVENFILMNPGEFLKLDMFRAEMLSYKGVLAGWGLRDMCVILGGGHNPPHWPRNIPIAVLRILAECMPGVENFRGVEQS